MLHLNFQLQPVTLNVPIIVSNQLISKYTAIVVELKFSFFKGYGEIVIFDDGAATIAVLEKEKKNIEQYAYNGPERFWHFLHHLIPHQEAVIAGLDMASWDLYAQMKKVPLHRVFGMQWKDVKQTAINASVLATANFTALVAVFPKHPIYMQYFGQDINAQFKELKAEQLALVTVDLGSLSTVAELMPIISSAYHNGIRKFIVDFASVSATDLQAFRDAFSAIELYVASMASTTLFTQHIHLFDGAAIAPAVCGGITPALQMMQICKQQRKSIIMLASYEAFAGAYVQMHLIPVCDAMVLDAPLRTQTHLIYPLQPNADGLYQATHMPGSGYKPMMGS